jgi:serine/threonine protein kinase
MLTSLIGARVQGMGARGIDYIGQVRAATDAKVLFLEFWHPDEDQGTDQLCCCVWNMAVLTNVLLNDCTEEFGLLEDIDGMFDSFESLTARKNDVLVAEGEMIWRMVILLRGTFAETSKCGVNMMQPVGRRSTSTSFDAQHFGTFSVMCSTSTIVVTSPTANLLVCDEPRMVQMFAKRRRSSSTSSTSSTSTSTSISTSTSNSSNSTGSGSTQDGNDLAPAGQPERSLDNPCRPIATKPVIQLRELDVMDIIGVGSTGTVRLVRHVPTDHVYAVKSMSKSVAGSAKAMEHIVSERFALQELFRDPFCVSLLDAYQTHTMLHLLTEYVPGGELLARIDGRRMSDREASFYAANVLLALEHLHTNGYVHRDLKPENILIGRNGYVKLADMGFVKRIDDGRSFTVCGTSDYRAPEVLNGTGTGRSADLWSLAVLIFEMLTGETPFSHDDSRSVLETYTNIRRASYTIPYYVSAVAASLIRSMLLINESDRLELDAIKAHPWFAWVNWQQMYDQVARPPFVPKKGKQYSAYDMTYVLGRSSDLTVSDKPSHNAFDDPSFSTFWHWSDDVNHSFDGSAEKPMASISCD